MCTVAWWLALLPHSEKVLGSIPPWAVWSLHVLPAFAWGDFDFLPKTCSCAVFPLVPTQCKLNNFYLKIWKWNTVVLIKFPYSAVYCIYLFRLNKMDFCHCTQNLCHICVGIIPLFE